MLGHEIRNGVRNIACQSNLVFSYSYVVYIARTAWGIHTCTRDVFNLNAVLGNGFAVGGELKENGHFRAAQFSNSLFIKIR